MKNANDPINLDRLEEELTRISPWPWQGHRTTNYDGEWMMAISMEDGRGGYQFVSTDTTGGADWNNAAFIAKAPETIAALVKKLKDQQAALKQIAAIGRFEKDGKVVYNLQGEIADNALPKELRLKRGSDEV